MAIFGHVSVGRESASWHVRLSPGHAERALRQALPPAHPDERQPLLKYFGLTFSRAITKGRMKRKEGENVTYDRFALLFHVETARLKVGLGRRDSLRGPGRGENPPLGRPLLPRRGRGERESVKICLHGGRGRRKWAAAAPGERDKDVNDVQSHLCVVLSTFKSRSGRRRKEMRFFCSGGQRRIVDRKPLLLARRSGG